MHEWALAEAVVESVKNRCRQKSEVGVAVGMLQGVDRECFDFALDEVAKAQGLDVVFKVSEEEAAFKCRVCSKTWVFDENSLDMDAREMIHFVPDIAGAYVKCPGCSSRDYEVTDGRGVKVTEVSDGP